MDKVRKVIEGKAVLKVVDVDTSATSALEEKLGAMSLAGAEKDQKRNLPMIRKDSWTHVPTTAEKKPILG